MGRKRSSIDGFGSESVGTFGRSDLEAVNGEEKDQGYDKLCKFMEVRRGLRFYSLACRK